MFKFLYPINFKFIMENNYFNLRPKSLPDALSLRRWFCLILLSVIFTMANNEASAQTVEQQCSSGKPTIFGEDASNKIANDAKIRVSGVSGIYKIGFTAGPVYTGNYASAILFPADGYISKELPTPSDQAGQVYTIRFYNQAVNDTTCYFETKYTLPYVNFHEKPKYVDIEVAVIKTPTGDSPIDSEVEVKVTVNNKSEEKDATGVSFNIAAGAGLQFVRFSLPIAGQNYDPTTKIWTIGNVPAKAGYDLILIYKVVKRGIHEVKAWNSALNENDSDSSPTQNALPEDDQGQVCITTPFDFCKGDEYAYTITGDAKNIQWFRNGAAVTDADAIVAEGGKILNIKATGSYTYTAIFGANCPATGCCPIVLEAGLPPILVKPGDQTICYSANFTKIEVKNSQNGAFKSDQGDFTYQWYKSDPSSPAFVATGDSINARGAGDIELPSTLLPKVPGTYSYRIIAYQTNHKNCKDSVELKLIINELPVVAASVTSPVCEEAAVKFDVTVTPKGGSTLPPNLTYAWTGPEAFTSDQEKPQIAKATMKMGGDYIVSVSYDLFGQKCATSDTTNLIVNKLPDKPTVISPLTYCAEDKAEKLSANGEPGNKLYWYYNSSPNPPVYGSKAELIDSSAAGTNVGPIPYLGTVGRSHYFVSQIGANRCESPIATIEILILTKPTKPVVDDLAYCQGETSKPLKADMAGTTGYELVWYANDSTGTGTPGSTFTAPSTANPGKLTYYVIQQTIANGTTVVKSCASYMAKIDVSIHAAPVIPSVELPDPSCVGSPEKALVATPTTGNSLVWLWNGVQQPTAPKPSTSQSGGTFAYVSQTHTYNDAIPSKPGSTLTCESAKVEIPIVINPLPVAEMIPISAICVGGKPGNSAELVLTRYRNSDQVSWSLGSTFNEGSASGFKSPDAGGVFATSLSNPDEVTAKQDYTVRIKNAMGCTIDRTLPLVYKDCGCPGYCEPAVITKTK